MFEKFKEKLDGDGGWGNGGFFVLEPKVINFISTILIFKKNIAITC